MCMCTVNRFTDISQLHCTLNPIARLSKSPPSFMSLCAVTHPPSLSHHHHISQRSQTLARFGSRTHGASWFPFPSSPSSPVHRAVRGWMDWSAHTSLQLQTHPCCYIRAMQRLTNQIIIATGHTLTEDRGQ